VQLLNSLAQLPPASASDDPSTQASRRILHLLGHLYLHLLETYIDPTLSFHGQLAHLSAAAHLILALYSHNKGNFIPIQLFFDVMSMIKNVYFCVAKTQVDNPDGQFWIILLGTDGLEKTFGTVRTMIGNDSHADQLQLTNRIDGAVQCVKILELHPEWGGGSRRITVKSLEQQGNNISQKMDHINPKSWIGDVFVKNVVLRSSWQEGRRIAEEQLKEANIGNPFHAMDIGDGYDMLCPFWGNRVVLINGNIAAGEEEETPEEHDEVNMSNNDVLRSGSSEMDEGGPDLDDLAGNKEAEENENGTGRKFDAWLSVDGKPQHKATICRYYSSPFTVALS